MIFYVSCVTFFIWIVVNSEWLNNSILEWSSDLEETAFGKSFGSLGSYQARLAGFMELAEPKNWTPFGQEEGVRAFSHDQITETLVKVGYVPLFMILSTAASIAFWWHRKCLQIKNPDDRLFLISLTAITVSLGICSLAYGNLLFVAPINSLLGMLIGMGMVTIRRDQMEKKLRTSDLAAQEIDPNKINTSQPQDRYQQAALR